MFSFNQVFSLLYCGNVKGFEVVDVHTGQSNKVVYERLFIRDTLNDKFYCLLYETHGSHYTNHKYIYPEVGLEVAKHDDCWVEV